MSQHRAIILVAVFAGTTAMAPASGDTFRIPQRAPDVFGGWASTHVIVRAVPDVEPGTLPDGRLSFLTQAPPGETERALADLLESWEVTSIAPTGNVTPQNEELARELGLNRYYTIHVPQGTDTPTMVTELNAFPTHIEIAELDGIGGALQTFPNDPYFGNQYALHNTGQNIQGQTGIPDADIDAPEAWELHTGTDEIIIAIIDTGVSHSHPDLAAKLIPGWNTYNNNNDDDDGWIFVSHGTHCAGIASAISDNYQGVAGVSWGAKIMPVKVLSDLGTGTEAQCADGIIWAADHGANVGSMSLGYTDGTSYFHNAVNYGHDQGMVLVAAAGNTPGSHFYPALWDNTIAVGATDNRDQRASFSSYGPELSVAAPGVSVYSCIDDLWNGFDTYTYMDGTSMACPHVAGLACLTWSANLALSNDELRAVIESTTDDKGTPGWDQYYGHGRINAYGAVSTAMEPEIPGDLNGDGCVDQSDLGILLAAFGVDDGGDIDGDSDTDQADLGILLAHWGEGCP
jgi:thermitase